MTMTETITIVTTHGILPVEGTNWARSVSSDEIHVYDDSDEGRDGPVATVPDRRFVCAFYGDEDDRFDYNDNHRPMTEHSTRSNGESAPDHSGDGAEVN